MPLDSDVAKIHDLLLAHTRRQRSSRARLSLEGSLTILGLILSALLLWTGAIMNLDGLLWVGLALLLVVLVVMLRSAWRDVREPGLEMAEAMRTRAAAEVPVLQDLQALPLPALTEVEAMLSQRITAVEAGMAFLLGGLKTAGVLGSLAVMLGAWSALTTAFEGLKPYSYLFAAMVAGVLIAGERLESGLQQIRRNRDLVSRTIAVRKLEQ